MPRRDGESQELVALARSDGRQCGIGLPSVGGAILNCLVMLLLLASCACPGNASGTSGHATTESCPLAGKTLRLEVARWCLSDVVQDWTQRVAPECQWDSDCLLGDVTGYSDGKFFFSCYVSGVFPERITDKQGSTRGMNVAANVLVEVSKWTPRYDSERGWNVVDIRVAGGRVLNWETELGSGPFAERCPPDYLLADADTRRAAKMRMAEIEERMISAPYQDSWNLRLPFWRMRESGWSFRGSDWDGSLKFTNGKTGEISQVTGGGTVTRLGGFGREVAEFVRTRSARDTVEATAPILLVHAPLVPIAWSFLDSDLLVALFRGEDVGDPAIRWFQHRWSSHQPDFEHRLDVDNDKETRWHVGMCFRIVRGRDATEADRVETVDGWLVTNPAFNADGNVTADPAVADSFRLYPLADRGFWLVSGNQSITWCDRTAWWERLGPDELRDKGLKHFVVREHPPFRSGHRFLQDARELEPEALVGASREGVIGNGRATFDATVRYFGGCLYVSGTSPSLAVMRPGLDGVVSASRESSIFSLSEYTAPFMINEVCQVLPTKFRGEDAVIVTGYRKFDGVGWPSEGTVPLTGIRSFLVAPSQGLMLQLPYSRLGAATLRRGTETLEPSTKRPPKGGWKWADFGDDVPDSGFSGPPNFDHPEQLPFSVDVRNWRGFFSVYWLVEEEEVTGRARPAVR
jgi:hypothetical protein